MQKKKKRDTNMERLSLKTTDVAGHHNRTSIYSDQGGKIKETRNLVSSETFVYCHWERFNFMASTDRTLQ